VSFAKEIRPTPGEIEAKLREEPDPAFYSDVSTVLEQALAVVEAEPDWRRAPRSALRLVDPRPTPILFAIADVALDQGAAHVQRGKNPPREERAFAIAALRAALDMLAKATAD
jgi:hypothetical protein